MAFQEFYCVPAGTAGASNMNAGDKLTSPATTTNGAYTQGGGAGGGTNDLFVAASGTPFSGATVGDYLSVYNDGASTPAFIGRIKVVNSSTSVDIDSTKSSGTRPTTAASGKTATLGGAWLGPTGAVGHPFGFITAATTDGSGNAPRVNGAGTSNITAAMTHANAGPIRFQGMTASPGDGGKWTIDGGTSGASYVLLTFSGTNNDLGDLIFQNNGASASANGLLLSGTECFVFRCVVHDVRGSGINVSTNLQVVECETYGCNQSNTSNLGGISSNSPTPLLRCISHDNSGSNNSGFVFSGTSSLFVFSCIADTNGFLGFNVLNNGYTTLLACDAYNNGSDGIRLANTSAASFYLENCNLIKNGGVGINGSGAGTRNGAVINCGFGSGTQANTSGTTTGLSAMVESGSVTYASGVTPWVDPANGDFRISLGAAKGVGRGSFTETQGGYTGTVAFPDIGAGQSKGGSGLPLGRTAGGL